MMGNSSADLTDATGEVVDRFHAMITSASAQE
jgi:hypothetical protein